MTADELIEILKASGADGWSVTDEMKEEWQFYFIRHALDQNRLVNTEHIEVTVYKKTEDGSCLGSAGEEIAPTAEKEEAEKTVAALCERAAYVSNPFYELRKPVPGENAEPGSGKNMTEICRAVSKDFIETMNGIPETETEDINSYEIFVRGVERHLITSTGIDVTQRYPSSMLEVVTNARNEQFLKTRRVGDGAEEIELYRMYTSGTCDRAGLARNIAAVMRYGRDRLRTVPTPNLLKIPVIFSTSDALQIYQYFVDRMSARMVYQKLSDWRIGERVANDTEGDPLTVTAKKYLPNSSRNYAFDAEGAPVRDEVLIRDGVAENYWGGAMFSHYLGSENTFIVSNYEVSGGAESEEVLRSGRYLEVVEFSDFQVDATSGDLFGEIRLGYLHTEDGTVTPVSGGSVSGSMRDYVKRMYFSDTTVQYDNAVVPAVTKLMDVTVTGAGQQT